MIGNIFMCLNESTYNSNIPFELEGDYARKVYDEEGNLTEVLDTTFKEVCEDNRIKFGSVIELNIDDVNYFVIELNASWLNGGVSALLDLGSGWSYPNNCLMSNQEAMELINANQSELEE